MKRIVLAVLVLTSLTLTPVSLRPSQTTSRIGALIGNEAGGDTGAIIGGAIGGVLGFIGGAALGNALFPGPGTFLGLNGASWGAGLGTIAGGA